MSMMLSPEEYEKLTGRKLYVPPTREESYIRLLKFSESEHSEQEWLDEFIRVGLQYGSNETIMFDIFKMMVEGGRIPAEYQLPILMDIYINKTVPKAFARFLSRILKNEPKEAKEQRQEWIREELMDCIDEDDRLTIYRGECSDTDGYGSRPIHLAVSFTLDYERAKFFAKRRFLETANVYSFSIPVDKIAWYTNERNEAEIIVAPLGKGYTKYLIDVESIS